MLDLSTMTQLAQVALLEVLSAHWTILEMVRPRPDRVVVVFATCGLVGCCPFYLDRRRLRHRAYPGLQGNRCRLGAQIHCSFEAASELEIENAIIDQDNAGLPPKELKKRPAKQWARGGEAAYKAPPRRTWPYPT